MNAKKARTLRKYAKAVAERQKLPAKVSTHKIRKIKDPETEQEYEVPGTFFYRDCEARLYRNLKREYRKGNLRISETMKG